MADEWYLKDVPRLVSETDALYARIVQKDPTKTLDAVTAQRIVEFREWGESLDIYTDRLEGAVHRLGCFYVPRIMVPGPAFVFPMRSADGGYPCAQTKPLEGSALEVPGVKYRHIGDKSKAVGPNWLGNDPDTLRQIIEKQMVMCVEGPFDLLALRLVSPKYPTLTPLTKRLGRNHITYLRILGVKKLLIMYDNETQGEEAMRQQARQEQSMLVIPCECPKKDPSEALEKREWARELSSRIRQNFGY
jgi:hypothetical protein